MELTNTEPTLDMHAPERAVFVTDDNRRARRLRRGALRGRLACLSLARRARGRHVRARRLARHLAREADNAGAAVAQPEPKPLQLIESHARSMPRVSCCAQAVRTACARLAALAAPGLGHGPRRSGEAAGVDSAARSNPAPPAPSSPSTRRARARLDPQGLRGPAGAGEEDATAATAADLPRSAPRPDSDDRQAAPTRPGQEDTSTSTAA